MVLLTLKCSITKDALMEDYLKHALEIVKAQASVRVMEEDAIISMVRAVAASLKQLEEEPEAVVEERVPVMEPSKSIKEKSVTCLECGKTFKIITKKHLATHDLDAASYREKWGFKKKRLISRRPMKNWMRSWRNSVEIQKNYCRC